MAIAQAVLEFLDNMQPRTLFATHYHELTALALGGHLSHVACLTIDVREHNNDIIFMHKIVAGVANRSYGIQVAKMAGMPESVVSRAECVLNSLESNSITKSSVIQSENKKPTRQKSCVSDSLPPQLSLFG
jgi:DNA mismatch repair protein MutS